MDFVTKKDFEAAVVTIQKALDNNQLEEGYSHELLKTFMFAHGSSFDFAVSFKQVAFIPPDMAVKNRLHKLRNELKIHREGVGTEQKAVTKLEAEEKVLSALLLTLKE